VDLAGRVAMSLIELPSVPIENFSRTELDQLISLCRSKIAGASLTLPGQTLAEVFNRPSRSVRRIPR